MYPQISQFGMKIKFCNVALGKETLGGTKCNCLSKPASVFKCPGDETLKYSEEWDGAAFTFYLKHSKGHQEPFWSSKVVLVDCRPQQDKEYSVLLGETWKLQTNLLPAHYVHAWHSLSSSLALSPAGFPKVTTICSYRGSFGSLGNCPFSFPLWNSDASLSTTLLHIPICAAKSQLAASFLPNSSPGNFPKWAFSGPFWPCLCLTPPKRRQTQHPVAERTTQGNSPPVA